MELLCTTPTEAEMAVKAHIVEGIKSRCSSSFTPQDNLWFRRLNNDIYIGGDLDTVMICKLNTFGAVKFWYKVDL